MLRGYKKLHIKNEEAGLAFAHNGWVNATGQKQKYNQNGESHCFHCGSEDHWTKNCPKINKEHQGKLKTQFKNEEPEK